MKAAIQTIGAADPEYKPQTYVRIKALTWAKDSQGLYDYESRDINKHTLRTRSNSALTLVGDDVRLDQNEDEGPPSKDSTKLVKVIKEDDKYYIASMAEESNMTSQLWLIVRSLKIANPKKEYVLNQGDIVRLGRVMFKTVISPDGAWEKNTGISTTQSKCEPLPSNSEHSKDACRFCYDTCNSASNPLISLCGCNGSMRYVHLACLKAWIRTSLVPKIAPRISSYYWKSFACEVCKTPYPLAVTVGQTRHLLFDLNVADTKVSCHESLMLYSLCRDGEFAQVVHILRPDPSKGEFALGRSRGAEVRINDSTVSRYHARISYSAGGFVIEDNISKFGTLVYLRGKQELARESGMSVQVDRSIITFGVKEEAKNRCAVPAFCTLNKKWGAVEFQG